MINILNNALELDFKIPNSVYNDALENGHLHGTVAYNFDGSGNRITIPIHEVRKQATTTTTTTTTTTKQSATSNKLNTTGPTAPPHLRK